MGHTIECPECERKTVVYHFDWSALVCPGCRGEIKQRDFLMDDAAHTEAWRALVSLQRPEG